MGTVNKFILSEGEKVIWKGTLEDFKAAFSKQFVDARTLKEDTFFASLGGDYTLVREDVVDIDDTDGVFDIR